MSTETRQTDTDLGVVSVEVRTCDKCGKEATSDSAWHWLNLDAGLKIVGDPLPADFCSWTCLHSFAIERVHSLEAV